MNIEIYETGKNQLSAFLKIAEKQTERFQFHVMSNNHLHMKFLDRSNVCLSYLDFKEDSQFKIIDCEQVFFENPLMLDVSDVAKMISHVKNESILLSSEVAADGELQGFNCLIQNPEGEIVKEIIIPCYTNDVKNRTPQIDYGDKEINIEMSTKTLQELISEINEYNSTSLEISITSVDNNNFDIIFNATDDHNSRKKIKIIKKSGKDFEIVNGKIQQGKALYSLDYLTELITSTPAYNRINLKYGTDMPLMINYVSEIVQDEQHDRTENLTCFLAPKIIDDVGTRNTKTEQQAEEIEA